MKSIFVFFSYLLFELVICVPTLWAADSPLLLGHYSMQGGKALTDGHLRITPIAGNPLGKHLDLWMTLPASPRPIRQYDVEMTKRLHVVVVSADLSTFAHIHPTLNASGHFTIDQQFATPGLYHIYADGEPHGMDHQVFRFDAVIGPNEQQKPLAISPTGREVNVGPYTVDLSRVRLNVGNIDAVDVHILKGEEPAKDLHPYLGVPAHAVFLNCADLSYVHVHPQEMNSDMGAMMSHSSMKMTANLPENAVSSPNMTLHVSIREPGTYKMWLQFRGGDKLYIVPFILTAQ